MKRIRVDATSCKVKEISDRAEKNFLLKHNQKYIKSKYSYGLYYKNKLIQIFSVARPLREEDKDYQWEIVNNYSDKNYIIKDGTIELWNYLLEDKGCCSCIVYSSKNEQKLADYYDEHLNFNCYKRSRKIRNKNTWTERIDVYYPFSVVYRMDDLTDGSFYIGLCESQRSWENNYMGSGKRWVSHCRAHNDHKFKRTILKANFMTPAELREAEYTEINKYVIEREGHIIRKAKGKLLNLQCSKQGAHRPVTKCPECGSKAAHKKTCSHYKEIEPCPECGGIVGHHGNCSKAIICEECGAVGGNHKGFCSKAAVCPECGGKSNSHKKGCSKFKANKPCKFCGSTNGTHKKTCHLYKAPPPCSECGSINGHKKTCSQYKESASCPECGVVHGHLKSCSRYIPRKECSECGGKNGSHKKGCSHAEKCPECGYLVQSHRHAKTCSHYKEPKRDTSVCKECGGIGGHHRKGCSLSAKIEPCPECGIVQGHLKTCSKYSKGEPCPECGGIRGNHRKGCSKYKEKPDCPECGGHNGHHKKWCPEKNKKVDK